MAPSPAFFTEDAAGVSGFAGGGESPVIGAAAGDGGVVVAGALYTGFELKSGIALLTGGDEIAAMPCSCTAPAAWKGGPLAGMPALRIACLRRGRWFVGKAGLGRCSVAAQC